MFIQTYTTFCYLIPKEKNKIKSVSQKCPFQDPRFIHLYNLRQTQGFYLSYLHSQHPFIGLQIVYCLVQWGPGRKKKKKHDPPAGMAASYQAAACGRCCLKHGSSQIIPTDIHLCQMALAWRWVPAGLHWCRCTDAEKAVWIMEGVHVTGVRKRDWGGHIIYWPSSSIITRASGAAPISTMFTINNLESNCRSYIQKVF